MNEQAQMKAKEYQKKLDEMFSSEFQDDLLEVCIETFGEDSREQFEENLKRVGVYPKFNLHREAAMPIKTENDEQYFDYTSYSLMRSVYDKFDIDPNNYRDGTLEEDLKKNLMQKSSTSYVTCCVDKETNEVCYPIFIAMDSKLDDANIRGKLVHEVLHALEFMVERDEEGLKAKTGHFSWEETGKNILTAECMHTAILLTKIYPMLREKGYEIADDNTDYLFSMGEGFFKFFGTYFRQICRTACQPDLHELTDVIGVNNWEKFVELQNNKRNIFKSKEAEKGQLALVDIMQEYSRNNLGTRIGKATLNNQLDVDGKNKVVEELNQLMNEKESSIDLMQGEQL